MGSYLTPVRCISRTTDAILQLESDRRCVQQQIQDLATMSEKYEREASIRMAHNLNVSPENKSTGSIHELIPVAPRDDRSRDRDRVRERERERARDRERDRRQQITDRRPRSNRSW